MARDDSTFATFFHTSTLGMNTPRTSMVGLIVAGKYCLRRKIGVGLMTDCYVADDLVGGEKVAVKIEYAYTRRAHLKVECKAYALLHGAKGVPRVRRYWAEKAYRALVMDLLGPSLEDLFKFCSRMFSLKTVMLLAIQMVHRLETVHRHNMVHRAIKPDDFVMGNGSAVDVVHLVGFGLSKQYRDKSSHEHIAYREGCQPLLTRFSSIGARFGHEQWRRDDMESLGYVLVYFLRGRLPWQGVCAATLRQKQEMVTEKITSTPLSELCSGCPPELATYLNYCRGLRFAEAPSYAYLRQLFRDVMAREGIEEDGVFQWVELRRKIRQIQRETKMRNQARQK